jgi:tRNA G10  N-methylase Trm11
MIKYFFILGRNAMLSKAELFSFLETREIKFKEEFFQTNILVLEFEKEIEINIQNFGGLLKLGKISFEGSYEQLEKFLEKNEFIERDKFTYSILGDGEEGIFIQKFKDEKKRGIIRHGKKSMKTEEGELIPLPNAEVEIFFQETEKKIYLGLVEQDYSYKDIKKRDMDKPVRRQALAISPRLAKILINLSQAKSQELLLDPFCGVGGILQEALIQNIKVYGTDIDKLAIENCRRNLKWLEEQYKLKLSYQIFNLDAKKIPNQQFNAIATEPSLGELVKEKLPENEAKKFIERFENLIIPILQRIKQVKKPDAKIAITFPIIKNISPNLQLICQKTGLKISKLPGINFPIKESREDQFVSREIIVFE